jgi:hypothetical protein
MRHTASSRRDYMETTPSMPANSYRTVGAGGDPHASVHCDSVMASTGPVGGVSAVTHHSFPGKSKDRLWAG